MAAYLLETARSFPNPISGQEYNTIWKRPSSGDYETSDMAYGLGTGTDYFITFEGSGPGSFPLGKDGVHYIGDQEETCVANCGYTRAPVFRHYRGEKRDHKYSKGPELIEQDLGCENESWSSAGSGYNKEPRQSKPYFFCLDGENDDSVPLKVWYSYWPDNTIFTVGNDTPSSYGYTNGCGEGKYAECYTIGHICTSESDANKYGNAIPLYHYRYGNQNAGSGKDIDDFYTINPAGEVNLDGNPVECRDPMKREYEYQGIIGYVYADDLERQSSIYRDVGRIGPTGQCVDKSGWYTFPDPAWDMGFYHRGRKPSGSSSYDEDIGTPATIGFGNPDTADIADANANFEWMYGLNGAIKGAVPKFLGFEDCYDSQFFYYLYDTSYPWNGPIFGVQYALNDTPCCPNTTCDDESATDTGGSGYTSSTAVPCCRPNGHFYSHFYQIREDSWETTKTKMIISDHTAQASAESFEIVDTDSPRILFRYTTRTGDFNRGETINGWNIVSVFYYGDRLKCGLIELEGGTNAFTYNSTYTSSDGGEIKVLAGYGIADKCAFAGVYEFPKKVDFYKVELNPKALVPNRTLDEFKGEAVINNAGGVSEIIIINSGRGYTDKAKVQCITPKVLKNFSPTDNTNHLEDLISTEIEKSDGSVNMDGIGFGSVTFQDQSPSKQSQIVSGVFGTTGNVAQFPPDHDGVNAKVTPAVLRIEKFDEFGGIERILVVESGAGYDTEFAPPVFVIDPEFIDYKSPNVGDVTQLAQGIADQFVNIETPWEGYSPALITGEGETDTDPTEWVNMPDNDFGGTPKKFENLKTKRLGKPTSPGQTANTGFTIMSTPIASSAPDSYIRIAEVDTDLETKLCFDLPPSCLEINARSNVLDALPKREFWELISREDDRIKTYESDVMSAAYAVAVDLEEYQEKMSDLYGPFDKSRCLTMGQPKVYNIRRWFDMPCAYLSNVEKGSAILDEIEEGRDATDLRAFGYLPYKYCASKVKEAEFNVSMEIQGKTIGSMGQDFMDYLDQFKKPKMTPPRNPKAPTGGNGRDGSDYRVWKCNNGSVDGRCYRDPNDQNDIIFVPVGQDENTYDYNQNGYSEYEQFQLWLGDNLTSGSLTTNTPTWSWQENYQTDGGTTTDPNTGETTQNPPINNTANFGAQAEYTAFEVDCNPNPGDTNVPNHDCWDKYVRASGAPSDAPLDVFCGYDANGDGFGGERFWEITGPAMGTEEGGWTTPTGPTNPFCSACTGSGTLFSGFLAFFSSSGGQEPACGLQSVNDASIACDPTRIYTDNGDKVLVLGSYTGTMRVRNWLTGGVQALSNAINNLGNPYFSECDVDRGYTDGTGINEEF